MSSDEFGPFSYVRVPPDSTGKRTAAVRVYALDYSAGTVAFDVEEEVTGQTSLAEATIIRKSGTTSAGVIYVTVNTNSPVAEFTAGENLLVGGVFHAVLTTATPIYSQATALVGGNNPLNTQFVSREGAAHMRFSEGEQLTDAFGVTKVGQQDFVDQLTFPYNTNSYRIQWVSGGNASLTHLTNSNSVALDTNTGIGEYVQGTTNVYYPYHPGFGSLTEMTVICGDSGKTGVVRRWGRYDDSDGLYFEHSGSNVYVCLRNSTGGSVVTTKVSQSSWNGDRYDGLGGPGNLSGHSLTVSNLNLYWIDYAWLGAGRVRFGVYGNDGHRHILHSVLNGGANTAPYMKHGNLPFRIEVSNSQATASPSRISLTCAVIKNDGARINPDTKYSNQFSYANETAISASTTAWTPILVWRATPTIVSSTNRYISIPGSIGGYTTSPITLQLFQFASVNTSSWTQRYTSGLEFDASASVVLGGASFNTWFVEQSSSFTFKLTDHAPINTLTVAKANGAAGNIWCLAAKSITAVSSSVLAKLSWIDLE